MTLHAAKFRLSLLAVGCIINVTCVFKSHGQCLHSINVEYLAGGDFKLSSTVCPCHHGMMRPQVADGGTASNIGGSCE